MKLGACPRCLCQYFAETNVDRFFDGILEIWIGFTTFEEEKIIHAKSLSKLPDLTVATLPILPLTP